MNAEYEEVLLEAQLAIHGQRHLVGVLQAVTVGGRRLGTPAYCGCLLTDGASDAWRLTLLFDAHSRPVDLRSLAVPLEAFRFAVPAQIAIGHVAELMGDAWGSEACRRLERELETELAICVPVSGDQPRAVLLALLVTVEQVALAATLLVHAATAVRGYLPRERSPLAATILDAETLAERTEYELMRAVRYERPLAVVAVDLGREPRPEDIGAFALQRRRRWDIVGRFDADRPMLVAVLPETDRRGADGFVRRLAANSPTIRAGAAVFPDDGSSLTSLLFVARRRFE